MRTCPSCYREVEDSSHVICPDCGSNLPKPDQMSSDDASDYTPPIEGKADVPPPQDDGGRGMRLLVKTNTEDLIVHAILDRLIPKIKCIADLGEPTIPYPTKQVWIKEYEAELIDGRIAFVSIYIRRIKGGISITGREDKRYATAKAVSK